MIHNSLHQNHDAVVVIYKSCEILNFMEFCGILWSYICYNVNIKGNKSLLNHEKRNKMKKIFISALLLCLSLTFISCNGNGNKEVSSVEQNTSHSEENDSIAETDKIKEENGKESEAEQNKGNIASGDSSDSSEINGNENQSEENQLPILGEPKDTAKTVTAKSDEKTKNESSESITKPVDSAAATTAQNADEKNVTATTSAKTSKVIELPFIPIEDIM